MGVAGYLALPHGPDSNVMNAFPASDPLMQVGQECGCGCRVLTRGEVLTFHKLSGMVAATP